MKRFTGILIVIMACAVARAGDLGFRYVGGKCVNAKGETGYNPSYLGQCGDLRSVVLGRIEFEDMDFSGTLFSFADLHDSTFLNSKFVDVNFEKVGFSGTTFNNCTIQHASFAGADLKGLRIIQTEFIEADFSGADMQNGYLSELKVSKCKFSNANLSNASMVGATLSETDFIGANFNGANLSTADLSRSQLMKANFTGTILSKANLSGATVDNANFTKARLDSAVLTGGSFKAAVFRSSELRNARLKSADFSLADFASADLGGSLVDKAIWKDAKITKTTILPFSMDEAMRLGMVIGKLGDQLATLKAHNFYKIPVMGAMTDTNVYATCQASGLNVVCNASDGSFSDDKCLNIGLTDGGNPMSMLSATICAGNAPNNCPLLEGVFQYMGHKFGADSACGVVKGNYCAEGSSLRDMNALCVD